MRFPRGFPRRPPIFQNIEGKAAAEAFFIASVAAEIIALNGFRPALCRADRLVLGLSLSSAKSLLRPDRQAPRFDIK